MKEIIHRQNSLAISRQGTPASQLDFSTGNCQRVLVNKSGMIRAQMGTQNRSEMVAMQGSPCAPTRKDKG
jgi:hypothetical protein